jgi:hypothetical protein
MSWRLDDFESFWTYTNEIVGAIAEVIAALDDRERETVRSEIKAALDPIGYDLPGACINGVAR